MATLTESDPLPTLHGGNARQSSTLDAPDNANCTTESSDAPAVTKQNGTRIIGFVYDGRGTIARQKLWSTVFVNALVREEQYAAWIKDHADDLTP